MTDEKRLVRECRAGSREAMCAIYELYRNDLLTIARALLNDVAAAEDVVHDVYVAFAESVDTFELTGSLKGYLATCVCNRARDRIRSAKRAEEKLTQDCAEPAECPGPDQVLDRAELATSKTTPTSRRTCGSSSRASHTCSASARRSSRT